MFRLVVEEGTLSPPVRYIMCVRGVLPLLELGRRESFNPGDVLVALSSEALVVEATIIVLVRSMVIQESLATEIL